MGGGAWLAGFFVVGAFGQGLGVSSGRAGTPPPGFQQRLQAPNFGLPPVGPIPPLVPFQSEAPTLDQRRAFRQPGFQRPVFLPYAFPAYVGGYSREYSPPAQSVIVVQQPVPMVAGETAAEPRRPPVHSEIREYAGAAGDEAAFSGDHPDFVIALNDGTVHSAVAVWTANDMLQYVGSEGSHWTVPLASVDRRLTGRLNRERNLRLQLPAPSGR